MRLTKSQIEELIDLVLEAGLYLEHKTQRGAILDKLPTSLVGQIPYTSLAPALRIRVDLEHLNGLINDDGIPGIQLWLDAVDEIVGDVLDKKHRNKINEFRLQLIRRYETPRNICGLSNELQLELQDKLSRWVSEGRLTLEIIEKAYYFRCHQSLENDRLSTEPTIFLSELARALCGIISETPIEHPAIRFATALISCCEVPLLTWLKKAAVELKIPEVEVIRLSKCPGCLDHSERYVIVLAPRGVEFEVFGWRILSEQGEFSLDKAVRSKLPTQRISFDCDPTEHLGLYLKSISICPGAKIELCLPLQQMCIKVEDLKASPTFLSRATYELFRKNNITLRSYDRYFLPTEDDVYGVKKLWSKHWNNFISMDDSPVEYLSEEFFSQNYDAMQNFFNSKLGKAFVLTFVPSFYDDPPPIAYLIELGVVAAVWPTKENLNQKLFQNPQTWEDDILKYREEKTANILWDDPDAIPDLQFQYKVPF